jgi:hypothetical protein
LCICTYIHTHTHSYIFKHHNPVTIQYNNRSYIETAIFICLCYMNTLKCCSRMVYDTVVWYVGSIICKAPEWSYQTTRCQPRKPQCQFSLLWKLHARKEVNSIKVTLSMLYAIHSEFSNSCLFIICLILGPFICSDSKSVKTWSNRHSRDRSLFQTIKVTAL